MLAVSNEPGSVWIGAHVSVGVPHLNHGLVALLHNLVRNSMAARALMSVYEAHSGEGIG